AQGALAPATLHEEVCARRGEESHRPSPPTRVQASDLGHVLPPDVDWEDSRKHRLVDATENGPHRLCGRLYLPSGDLARLVQQMLMDRRATTADENGSGTQYREGGWSGDAKVGRAWCGEPAQQIALSILSALKAPLPVAPLTAGARTSDSR